MASKTEQYVEEMIVLQQRFPEQPRHKLFRILKQHNGDVDMVRALLIQEEYRFKIRSSMNEKYGELVDNLQKEDPIAATWQRFRLMKLVESFDGETELVRKFLQASDSHHVKNHHHHHRERRHSHEHHRKYRSGSRNENLAELKTKYSKELDQIAAAGFDIEHPRVLRQLNKHQGDVQAVLEKFIKQQERHQHRNEFQTKYAKQIDQLKADGIDMKNERVLARVIHKANGDVNLAKQLIDERREKHRLRKEYQQKHFDNHRAHSSDAAPNRERRALSVDDRENLKRLRSAGAHGNPQRLLGLFHECNESIELTVERVKAENEQRMNRRDGLKKINDSYTLLKTREDWPENTEEVYLDGNNMMFVVNSLRRLCLNHASKKTERALAELAAAWNEQMRIPTVHLVFDSTNQLESVDSVVVESARPKYATTDDMLIDIARQAEHRKKNERTIIVTSDRALATLLKNEGCKLVKPYHWFLHCMMVLTPDLIDHEQTSEPESPNAKSNRAKVLSNFDELIQRVVKMDL